MNILKAGVLLALVSLPAMLRGQDTPRLPSEATEVASAVLEWWGSRLANPPQRNIRLVLSDLSTEYHAPLPSTPTSKPLQHGVRRFGFSEKSLHPLEASLGLAISVCDSITSDNSLCGIPQPWTWMVFSPPSLEGNAATIILEVRSVRVGPPPERIQDREIERWQLQLMKEDGHWEVTSARRTAVS